MASDPFGSALIAAGVTEATIKAYSTDPQVLPPSDGEGGGDKHTSSLFDLLEDMDAAACLERCAATARANTAVRLVIHSSVHSP